MSVHFSKSTGGFYPDDMRSGYEAAGSWPVDAAEVTDTEYKRLLSGQSAGQQIVAGANGLPVLVDPPPPLLADLKAAALRDVRAMRAAFFPVLAGLQSEALARGNTADALAIAAVQQGARDITLTDLSACQDKAAISAKFLQAWIALISNAPASVIVAFQGLKS